MLTYSYDSMTGLVAQAVHHRTCTAMRGRARSLIPPDPLRLTLAAFYTPCFLPSLPQTSLDTQLAMPPIRTGDTKKVQPLSADTTPVIDQDNRDHQHFESDIDLIISDNRIFMAHSYQLMAAKYVSWRAN